MTEKLKKPALVKFISNTIISIVILLVLFIGAGIVYTWYMGQNPTDDGSAATAPTETTVNPVIKPTQQAANAKEGAAVQMITSPVIPGSNASVSVKTNPGSICTIAVVYNEVASKDSGLISKTADEWGEVNWSWTVESSRPLGKWPVKITCVRGKLSAFVQADLVIVAKLDQ